MNIPPTPTIPTTAPTTPRTPSMPSMSTPRQLKLPQSRSHHQLQQSQHHSTPNLQPGEQPPAPGRLLTYNRNLHDQQRMRIASGPARPSGLPRAPPSPVPPMPQSSPQYAADPNRPRPRIGAGMVYRKSTSPTAGSRMRTPSTRTRAPPVPQSIAL
ncbi:hypothetical protein PLICRDRAFT_508755 [Plicaturopsis crispa FD-325 SS-3]|nr:hypothetical protein PLICRDRAFT_508755 [Plicaturopsis crispa FD-325 SS-3]